MFTRLANTVRRWIRGWVLDDTRLNDAYFSAATSESINSELNAKLPDARVRCRHVARTSPDLAGIIETHVVDVVGGVGPDVTITAINDSDQPAFDTARGALAAWRPTACADGHRSDAEVLELGVRTLWTHGESLEQMIRPAPNRPMAVLPIDPARLGSTYTGTSTVMGVEVDANGVPVNYHIAATDPNTLTYSDVGRTNVVPAADITHYFDVLEPGQRRGAPLLLPSLSLLAKVEQYDAAVIDAAHIAASLSTWIGAPNQPISGRGLQANSAMNVEPGQARVLPPGYQPFQMRGEQPAGQYIATRHEWWRSIARAVNMPLMMALLNSANHNYSSARFDGQIYARGIKRLQRRLQHHKLRVWYGRVIREAMLADGARTIPAYRLDYIWPTLPHVDPHREAQAIAGMMKLGVMTYAEACANTGKSAEDQLAALVAEIDAFAAKGLTHPFVLAAADILGVPDGTDTDEARAAVVELVHDAADQLRDEAKAA